MMITKAEPVIKLKELYRIAKGIYERCFYEGYGIILEEGGQSSLYSDYGKINNIIDEIIDEILNANTNGLNRSSNQLFKILSDYMIKKV